MAETEGDGGGLEPKPNFTYAEWLSVFDKKEEVKPDGTMTSSEIKRAKGWTVWTTKKRINEELERGTLEWVRSEREYKGVRQLVIAYRAKR